MPDIKHTYIIASTLNQSVNLIPLLDTFRGIELDSVILNITLTDNKGTKLADNKKWDKYFEDVLSEKFGLKYTVQDIPLKASTLINTDDIVGELKKAINESSRSNPLFWNITGGQRPYLFATPQIIDNGRQDKVFYIDGNHGKYYWMFGNEVKSEMEIPSGKLTIKDSLRLMGYDVKNMAFDTCKESKDFSEIEDIYENYTKNSAFRKKLIESNKSVDLGRDTLLKGILHTVTLKRETVTFLERKFSAGSYPFGYLLEDLVCHIIENQCAGNFLEVAHSLKMAAPGSTGNQGMVDEFDVLVLTLTGQLVIFECKSGTMSGDVAKSTRYSTYRVGGVYGLPILITPLLEEEIKNKNDLTDPCYTEIIKSINAARRADLAFWGLDEVKNKFMDKIKSTR